MQAYTVAKISRVGEVNILEAPVSSVILPLQASISGNYLAYWVHLRSMRPPAAETGW